MSRLARSPSAVALAAAVLVCVAAGVAIGSFADEVTTGAVALLCLAPFVSQARWVGLSRLLREPSCATVVLIFYLFVFPLRGLALAVGDFEHLDRLAMWASPEDIEFALLMASAATTLFIEAFHFGRARAGRVRPRAAAASAGFEGGLTLLASVLGAVVLVSLGLIILSSGGIAAMKEIYIAHSKTAVGGQGSSFAGSLWQTLAVPSVWVAAYVALHRGSPSLHRAAFSGYVVVLLAVMLILFGSRLNALLSLLGIWAVFHYERRPIPVAAILAAIPLVILVSIPIVAQRPGGDVNAVHHFGVPTYERYSSVAGYGVLEASLAVQNEPDEVRDDLLHAERWLNLPLYLVPSAIWPNKPNFEPYRLDGVVARTFGNRNQQDTGFPTSYMTELYVYGGWLAVFGFSLAFGVLAGWLDRKSLRLWADHGAPAGLILHALVVVSVFSLYKDGDVLMTLVSTTRLAVYIGAATIITGVWSVQRRRGRQGATREIGGLRGAAAGSA